VDREEMSDDLAENGARSGSRTSTLAPTSASSWIEFVVNLSDAQLVDEKAPTCSPRRRWSLPTAAFDAMVVDEAQDFFAGWWTRSTICATVPTQSGRFSTSAESQA